MRKPTIAKYIGMKKPSPKEDIFSLASLNSLGRHRAQHDACHECPKDHAHLIATRCIDAKPQYRRYYHCRKTLGLGLNG